MSAPGRFKELNTKLCHLRLSGFVEARPIRNQQAVHNNLAQVEFLELLVEDELTRRRDRLHVRHLKRAHILQVKTLDSFDWGGHAATITSPPRMAGFQVITGGRFWVTGDSQEGVVPSIGSLGDAHDNTMAEGFFATLECELIKRIVWRSKNDARRAIFDYIEAFYNPRRRHSSLVYLSPVEFERRSINRPAAA